MSPHPATVSADPQLAPAMPLAACRNVHFSRPPRRLFHDHQIGGVDFSAPAGDILFKSDWKSPVGAALPGFPEALRIFREPPFKLTAAPEGRPARIRTKNSEDDFFNHFIFVVSRRDIQLLALGGHILF